MRREEEEGKRPLYRPREWQEVERMNKKSSRKTSWSKAGKKAGEIARAPLIISPVAGGSTTKKMKEVCRKFSIQHNIHVQVKQRGGQKMSRDAKSNPLRKGGCGREDCMVCTTSGRGDCSKSGAGYKITCMDCPKDKLVTSYEGETGRNPYSRGLEHQADLRNEKEASPLWKHCLIQHNGNKAIFKMDALRSFKYPMVRQVNEGARVRISKANICMNSRSEFHQPAIVRVMAVRGNLNELQTGISLLAGRPRGGTRGWVRGRGRRRPDLAGRRQGN